MIQTPYSQRRSLELYSPNQAVKILEGGGTYFRCISTQQYFEISFDGNNWRTGQTGSRFKSEVPFERIFLRCPATGLTTCLVTFDYGTVDLDFIEAQSFYQNIREHPTITIGGSESLANNGETALNPWTNNAFFATSTYANQFVTSPAISPYQQKEVRVFNTHATASLILVCRGSAAITGVPPLTERVIQTRSQISVKNLSGIAITHYSSATFYTPEFLGWQYTLA